MALFSLSKTLFSAVSYFQFSAVSSVSKASRLVGNSFAHKFHLQTALKQEENSNHNSEVNIKDASRDRSKIIPVETSIRYLKSSAYATTYGSEPVWVPYRRNHKGAFAPRRTRKTCIRNGQVTAGNPCPICRDEYLIIHPENTGLLKQFISSQSGQIISYSKTGVCQRKHKQLVVAIEVAKDKGLLTYDVPFREYDYSLYKPKPQKTTK